MLSRHFQCFEFVNLRDYLIAVVFASPNAKHEVLGPIPRWDKIGLFPKVATELNMFLMYMLF